MFYVFTLARSGSTAVQKVLSEYVGGNCFFEPFQPTWGKHRDFKTINGLRNKLQIISKDYQGFKGLGNHLSDEENFFLFKQPDMKVIFLRRKNILQREISEFLGNNANIWLHKSQVDLNLKINTKLRINIERFKESMDETISYYLKMEKYLKENNIEFINIYYEDIFLKDILLQEKLLEIKKITDFLGIKGKPNDNVYKILDFKEKINNQESYKIISNLNEITRLFSGKKYGHL